MSINHVQVAHQAIGIIYNNKGILFNSCAFVFRRNLVLESIFAICRFYNHLYFLSCRPLWNYKSPGRSVHLIWWSGRKWGNRYPEMNRIVERKMIDHPEILHRFEAVGSAV